ncbi:MAG: DNA modification methylase [Chloroflexi bacterium]|nr:DNA modification methylase [Chloroflexota bacterium]
MRLPVHGWFRFPAGFSAEWAESVIESCKSTVDGLAFLDPFAGVGTSVLAAESAGVRAYGVEAQPFIQRIAEAKLLWYTTTNDFHDMAQAVADRAKTERRMEPSYPDLIHGCFTKEAIRDLDSLRCAWDHLNDGSPAAKLTWLALVSILRACSFAGTAPWQYVLPAKTKAKVLAPYEAFTLQVRRMLSDMTLWQGFEVRHEANIFLDDARSCGSITDGSVGLVVTSPPYANNYDYADATRLEMTFLGEVHGWGELHERARKRLIRSCSQHASIEKLSLDPLLGALHGTTFIEEISTACERLAEERLNHGGKKDYHLMVAAYFLDMKEVWRTLRRVCAEGSEVCFVVGDSAPYGIHIPTDRWLGELAFQAGFRSYRFEKIRDRNVKWKNRKHRVPLHEGFLWVQG